MFAGPQFVHLLAVGRCLDFKTLFAEIANQQVAQAGVVIDDEDVGVLFVHGGKDKGVQ
jgi:hypothetical protein